MKRSVKRGGKGGSRDKGVELSKDQRFWKNEKAIQRAFFRAREMISAKLLAQKARISRATLYRHHQNVYQIMPDIEEATLRSFETEITEVKFKKGVKVRWLFYRMLAFIRKNRTEFREIVRRGDERVLEEMVDQLMPKIVKNYHLAMANEEMVRVYQKEIIGVIETWILDDFEESEIKVLKDIMYLTRTARKYLMVLGHQN